MKNIIDISVIVPVYGVEQYIERCIRSLFEQTINDRIEYIFVNDATTDASIEILKKVLEEYPLRKKQVRIINHENNQGLAASRRTAVLAARGEYIIACDSDDWVEPSAYENLLAAAQEMDADMVICDYYEETDKGTLIHPQPAFGTTLEILKKAFNNDIHNNLWNKLIRREKYLQLNPLFIKGVNMWEDLSVIFRLIYSCNKISHIPLALYHYNRLNPEAYTTSKWKSEYNENILEVLKLNHEFFITKQIDDSALMSRGLELLILSTKDKKQKDIIELQKKILPGGLKYIECRSWKSKMILWFRTHSMGIIADSILKIKKGSCLN